MCEECDISKAALKMSGTEDVKSQGKDSAFIIVPLITLAMVNPSFGS
jgi:hypothetical protein